jgi:hypothetical protein
MEPMGHLLVTLYVCLQGSCVHVDAYSDVHASLFGCACMVLLSMQVGQPGRNLAGDHASTQQQFPRHMHPSKQHPSKNQEICGH